MLKLIKLEMKKEVTVDTTENTKDHKSLYKQLYNLKNGELRRNAQILRKVQTFKTKAGRNSKYEHSNHKH